jgi:hypothetical protein
MPVPKLASQSEDAVSNYVDPSIRAYCFHGLANGRQALSRDLEDAALPRTVSAVSKFAGLLLQAHWLAAKCVGVPLGGMLERVDNLLLQVWAGHQRYSESIAMSLLYETSLSQPSAGLVNDPEIIALWKDLLALRHGVRFRYFEQRVRDIDQSASFVRLLRALPILKWKIEEDFFVVAQGRKISTFPFLSHSAQIDNPLFLYAIEHTAQGTRITFEDPYSSFTEKFRPTKGTPEFEALKGINIALGLEQVQEGILYLFGDEYQHIHNLALAITETPSGDPRAGSALRELKERYSKDYDDELTSRSNLSDFVTLLLADNGPLVIIRQLLKGDRQLHETYFRHLLRGDQALVIQSTQHLESMIDVKTKAIKRMIDDTMRLDRMLEDAVLDARATAVLHASGLKFQPRPVVESIDMRIKAVEHLYAHIKPAGANMDAILNAGLRINLIGERTLKFVICFYSGLKAYHRSRLQNGSDDIQCEKALIEGFRRAYTTIHLCPLGVLIDKLRTMLVEPEQHWVTAVLGRKAICEIGIFEKLTTKWTASGIINRIKHDKGEKPIVTRDEMLAFIIDTLEVLRFLRNGNNEEVGDYSLEPVYPTVISFYEAHRKRDGLMIYNYEISSLADQEQTHEQRIKILTPRQYSANEDYYCIPVFHRSTHTWWLEPFLIRCSVINSLVVKDDGVIYDPE